MAGGDGPTVIAVVVTCNRRQLLLEALAAVHAQSRAPDAVIVVDNASTDGTAAAVRRHYPSVRLAGLTRNTGGAGGFAYGTALALAGGADLIWFMDDDTVPEPGALRALLAARERYPGPAPRAGRQPRDLDRRAGAPDEHPAQQAVRQPGRTPGGRGGGRPCRSVRHRSSRSSWTPGCAAGAACRGRTTSCGTTTSNSPPGCCAATPACSARPASSCTRRPRSARRTPTPGSASSTRSGTRSGCSGIPHRSRPSSGRCTPARRCAAGHAPLPAHATGAPSDPHLSGASPPGCGRDRGQPGRCSRRPARPCQSAAMPAAPAGTRVITAGSWYRQENS